MDGRRLSDLDVQRNSSSPQKLSMPMKLDQKLGPPLSLKQGIYRTSSPTRHRLYQLVEAANPAVRGGGFTQQSLNGWDWGILLLMTPV